MAPRRKLRKSVRLTAVVTVAVAVGFVVWLFVRNDNSESTTPSVPTATAPTTTTPPAQPVVVGATVANLKAYAAVAGHDVYWIGPKAGFRYELTRTSDGRIYIRYLPPGVRIGDPRANFIIVGTYPVENAIEAIRTAAKAAGAVTIKLKGGRLGVYNTNSPTNVYFADPGSNYQIEVFDPDAAAARRLVTRGAVRPIR